MSNNYTAHMKLVPQMFRDQVANQLKLYKSDGQKLKALLRLISRGKLYTKVMQVGDYPPLDAWVKKVKPKAKECYKNAQRCVMDSVAGVKYCEGYIFSGNEIIPHAWLIHKDEVIDPTLSSKLMPNDMKRFKLVRPIKLEDQPFYGRTFTRDQVAQKVFGVCSNVGLLDLPEPPMRFD